MRVAIIGRSEILFEAMNLIVDNGHEISAIITAKEAPEYTIKSSDFEKKAKEVGVAYYYTHKIDEIIGPISQIGEIDIGISVNYTGLIPQKFIDLFPLGILNAHGGDLPRYRGNACQAWAILNGEDRIGLCVHKMVGGELDSGDILARDYYGITLNTKVTEVHQWMSDRVPYLFLRAINELSTNPEFVLQNQSSSAKKALRCYPRRPEDGRIDWSKSNIEILRLINASNHPYAGAFCYFEGQKVIIWDAEIAPHENFLATPGQITKIGKTYIEVACGEGKLRLNEIDVQDRIIHPNNLFRSVRKRLD